MAGVRSVVLVRPRGDLVFEVEVIEVHDDLEQDLHHEMASRRIAAYDEWEWALQARACLNPPQPKLTMKVAPLLAVVIAAALPLTVKAEQDNHPVGDRQSTDAAPAQSVPPALAATHAAPDAGITTGNAASLQHAWTFQTEMPVSSSALVDGGDLFFADWAATPTSSTPRRAR